MHIVKDSLKTIITSFIISLSVYAVFAAWSDPTAPPTGGNIAAPVNVGSTSQVKSGGLGVASLTVDGGTIFSGAVTMTSFKLSTGAGVSKVLTSDASGNGTWQVTAGGIPAGTVNAYVGVTAPSGWLEANGSAVSRVTYADLFAIIGTSFGSGDGATTFNLPDLRGRFIRGWDHGSGRDPDAASRTASNPGGAIGNNIGSLQADMFASHQHTVSDNYAVGLGAGPYPYGANGGISGATGGSETRPKNVYLMYIIKY